MTETKLSAEQQVAKLRAQFGPTGRTLRDAEVDAAKACPGCVEQCGQCHVEGGALD